MSFPQRRSDQDNALEPDRRTPCDYVRSMDKRRRVTSTNACLLHSFAYGPREDSPVGKVCFFYSPASIRSNRGEAIVKEVGDRGAFHERLAAPVQLTQFVQDIVVVEDCGRSPIIAGHAIRSRR